MPLEVTVPAPCRHNCPLLLQYMAGAVRRLVAVACQLSGTAVAGRLCCAVLLPRADEIIVWLGTPGEVVQNNGLAFNMCVNNNYSDEARRVNEPGTQN